VTLEVTDHHRAHQRGRTETLLQSGLLFVLQILPGAEEVAVPNCEDRLKSMTVDEGRHFVYHQIMDSDDVDLTVTSIAAAIGELARARMLLALSDGRARTSTELAVLANVSPSTASVHLQRLKGERLVKVLAQGKHRYYSLESRRVAAALEALALLAGAPRASFSPSTPSRLRIARTCYDHLAGILGVSLHERFQKLGWLARVSAGSQDYDLTAKGVEALESLGEDVTSVRALRRRFAFPCVDWSEHRPHIGGALGAVLLKIALKREWVLRDLDSRALEITGRGRRELLSRFGLHV
jgi:DNA-binding transcriptional ArsR family regulator